MTQLTQWKTSGWTRLLSLLMLMLMTGLSAVSANAPPNFVVILADDCTFSDLACYGGQALTPRIDGLARQGMQMDHCFQAAPMCSPTRHALYTGIYPVKSGAYPNHTFVKPATKSVAHYLKAAGYRVALSGKTHINPPESFPFEYSKGSPPTGKKNNPSWPAIDKLMSECSQDGRPFCLFACSNEPHTPYSLGDPSRYDLDKIELPPHYVDTPATRQAFRKYLAEISYFDGQVGRCLDLLAKHQLEDNTLVIMLSEQGSGFPFAKWTCYDAGLQSGMIVRWPGKVPAGSRSDAIVEYIDIVPTMLQLAGLKTPRTMDGESLHHVLSGQRKSHKHYSFGLQTSRGINNGPAHYGIRSVRSDRYRYILNLTPEVAFQNTMFTSNWWREWESLAADGDKLARRITERFQHRPAIELYDCQRDPWNLTNLAGTPGLAATERTLARQLNHWMQSQGDLGQQTELAATSRQWGKRNQLQRSQPKAAPR